MATRNQDSKRWLNSCEQQGGLGRVLIYDCIQGKRQATETLAQNRNLDVIYRAPARSQQVLELNHESSATCKVLVQGNEAKLQITTIQRHRCDNAAMRRWRNSF